MFPSDFILEMVNGIRSLQEAKGEHPSAISAKFDKLPKTDESRAGNSLTAAGTASPSFSASSWLGASMLRRRTGL